MDLLVVESVVLLLVSCFWCGAFTVAILKTEYPHRYRQLTCDGSKYNTNRPAGTGAGGTWGLPHYVRRLTLVVGLWLIVMSVDLGASRHIYPYRTSRMCSPAAFDFHTHLLVVLEMSWIASVVIQIMYVCIGATWILFTSRALYRQLNTHVPVWLIRSLYILPAIECVVPCIGLVIWLAADMPIGVPVGRITTIGICILLLALLHVMVYRLRTELKAFIQHSGGGGKPMQPPPPPTPSAAATKSSPQTLPLPASAALYVSATARKDTLTITVAPASPRSAATTTAGPSRAAAVPPSPHAGGGGGRGGGVVAAASGSLDTSHIAEAISKLTAQVLLSTVIILGACGSAFLRCLNEFADLTLVDSGLKAGAQVADRIGFYAYYLLPIASVLMSSNAFNCCGGNSKPVRSVTVHPSTGPNSTLPTGPAPSAGLASTAGGGTVQLTT